MSESVSLTVKGMKCGGCENTVAATLTALEGVISINASHLEKRVDVEYDPAKINLDDIEDAIIDAGFTVE